MAWWISIALLLATFVFLSVKGRVQSAVGIVGFISLAFPSWVLYTLFPSKTTIVGTGIEVPFLVCSGILLLYSFLPGRTFPMALLPCDLCVMALIILHLISDQNARGLGWVDVGKAYVEWYMPYLIGRLAIQSREDFECLLPVVAGLAGLLGIVAAVEAIVGINFFEVVFGNRPIEGMQRDASRWGMKRAFGPCLHPIYFGAVQLLFFPFALTCARRALQKRAHAVWIFVPLVCALGIFCTGSRGPLIGLAILVVFVVFTLVSQARIPIAIGAGLVLVLIFLNGTAVLKQLESWSGEQQRYRPRQAKEVVVDNQERALTGTTSRILLLDVYRIAVRKSGWLGFGSEAVSSFPVNVPVGPQEVETLQRLRNIDNVYVLFTLRFGYFGIAAFSMILITAIGQAIWLAFKNPGSTSQFFSAAVAGTLLGMAFVLFTVWLPPDIDLPLMMVAGASSGLLFSSISGKIARRRNENEDDE